MSRPGGTGGPADPLVGIDRLLVDGSNLLYALRRQAPGPLTARPAGGRAAGAARTGDPGAEPAAGPGLATATLIGRLRAVIPADVRIVLVFDGPPDRGLGTSRIAAGLTVRYAGRETADRLIERMVEDAAAPSLVVTDDRALAASVRNAGSATVGNGWLIRRLARPRLAAPAAGRPRPPLPGPSGGEAAGRSPAAGREGGLARDAEADADARRWRPGRGATRKRGNPRRGHGPGAPPGHGPGQRPGPS